MHCGLITLLVIVHPAGALGGVFSCSLGRTSLKLPCSSAVVGTVKFCGLAERRIFFHSCPAKKNSLLWIIGPPTFQPKSLKRRGEVFVPFTFELGLRASNISLRTNSN